MTAQRSTLNDLAESLGLSANTVSRALRGKDGVSQRTRDRVLEAAIRTGYITVPGSRPSSQLSAITAAPKAIALSIPSPTHTFASHLIGAIEAGARAAGYSLVLFVTEEDEAQEKVIAEQIREQQLAGAIVIAVQGADEPWRQVQAQGIPVVAVSREIPDLPADFVGVDSEAGEYAAVRHLLNQGARAIVAFEEDLEISTITQRQHGFARAMNEVESAQARTVRVPTRRFENTGPQWRAEEAYRACLDLLAEGHRFDAVAVGDDYFALGVIRALSEQGIHVPEDVPIVGYGDLPFSAWTTPSLSSVQLPTKLVGELAVSILLQRIAGDGGAASRRLIRPELVIRASSGARQAALTGLGARPISR